MSFNIIINAIKDNNIEIFNVELNKLNDINLQNINNETLLNYAVFQNRIDMVEILLKRGANPNILNNKGIISLHCAIHLNNLKMIELLLSYGANIKYTFTKLYNDQSWLYIAIDNKNINIIKLLLNHGADPNKHNTDGKTPLNIALNKYNRDKYLMPHIIELLLNHGANPNTQDSDGTTALHKSVNNNDIKITELFLKHGGDPNIRNNKGETSLMNIISRCRHEVNYIYDVNIIKLLLNHGADPNIQEKLNGYTTLHEALYYDRYINKPNINILELLLKHGANPNIHDKFNQYPLQFAVSINCINAVKILLSPYMNIINDQKEHNNDKKEVTQIINAPFGYQYNTVLHDAVRIYNIKMIEMLLSLGGDPNIRNINGDTPLHLAVLKLNNNNKSKYNEKINKIINLLLSYGANADIKNKKNKSCSQLLLKK